MNTKNLLITGMFAGLFLSCKEVEPPAPVLPVPTPEQIKWQKMENYAFVHFGLNTFNDLEWGYGNTPAETFNPTDLDCEQWVRIIKAAGLKGVILTAKHHDGFCLWPTKTVDYNISNSPYKNGKGDMVRELSDACKKHGLKFGLYLSPWDRHNAEYGWEGYQKTYHEQINELISNYGPLFEFWFDGANGGNGWYGGTNETRSIDPKTYYGYETAREMIKAKHPEAMIFGGTVPDIRWIGNESGWAGETNWSPYSLDKETHYTQNQWGMKDGNQWLPGECDVSIRPGWFYHEAEDSKVKSLKHLSDIYFRSVGYNSVLLLNIPPNRKGLISEADVNRLKEFAAYRQQIFADNRVKKGRNYWNATSGSEAVYSLKPKSEINVVMLQEDITKGQRVEAFTVEALTDNGWKEVGKGTTIGYKRMLRFPAVKAGRLRVKIDECRLTAHINQVAAYYAPPLQATVQGEDWNNLPRTGWKQVAASPLTIDLGKSVTLTSFTYAPLKAEAKPTMAFRYKFFVSADGKNWKEVPTNGEFSNIMHNPLPQTVAFGQKVQARYIKLEATTPTATTAKVEMNEIGVKITP